MTSPIIQTTAELLERLDQLRAMGCIPWPAVERGTPLIQLKEFGEWRCVCNFERSCAECGSPNGYVAVGFPRSDGAGHFPCALMISENVWWAI